MPKNGLADLMQATAPDICDEDIPKPQYGSLDQATIDRLAGRVFMLETHAVALQEAFDKQAAQIVALKARLAEQVG